MPNLLTTVRGSCARAKVGPAVAALAAVAVLLPTGDAFARGAKPAEGETVPGRYIVVYAASVSSVATETQQKERRLGFQARHEYSHAVKGFAARLTASQVRALRADPEVAFVTPDRVVHALGAVPLRAGERVPTGVARMQAATSTWVHEASDVGVAVVDSGVDLAHPDLNAVSGTNCVTPGSPARDDNGHGTHVAGTIGAENDGAGVVGIAPGTRIYAVKVLDATGAGSWSSVICGIDWVTANAAALGIKIANLSLGGLGSNDNRCGTTDGDVLHAAVCRATQAGVLQVVAAGNDGWDLGDSPPDVPAAYPEVLAVTALADSDGAPGAKGAAPACATDEADDAAARFSNFASRAGDAAHMIAAPGVCILSTWPGGGYAVSSGTSMAAPHVAALAALCLGEAGVPGPCAGKTPAQVIEHLRSDAAAYATANPTYGFAGDPLRPNAWNDYYGPAARALPDTAPPRARLVASPAAIVASSTVRFELAADAGARFECRLDGGAWSACSSPVSYSGLADGPHVFEARGTDVAGNVDPTPASARFSVDTLPAETTVTGGGGLTNDSTPAFAFAASESGVSFECRLGVGAWTPCASPHAVGPLGDGAHSIEVRAVDQAGNVDPTPARVSVTVDTVAPRASIAAGPADPTKERAPTFELSTDDAGSRLECRLDGAAWAPCASPHRTAALADGRHVFQVRAVDAATNASHAAEWQFTLDTTTTWTPPEASTPEAAPPPAAVPTLPPPVETPTTPVDRIAPALTVSVARQRLGAVVRKGLSASVACSEACAVSARVVLAGRAAKRLGLSRGAPVVVGRASLGMRAGRRAVVVRLTARAKARLAAVGSVLLTLQVTGTDAAGNARSAARRVTLHR